MSRAILEAIAELPAPLALDFAFELLAAVIRRNVRELGADHRQRIAAAANAVSLLSIEIERAWNGGGVELAPRETLGLDSETVTVVELPRRRMVESLDCADCGPDGDYGVPLYEGEERPTGPVYCQAHQEIRDAAEVERRRAVCRAVCRDGTVDLLDRIAVDDGSMAEELLREAAVEIRRLRAPSRESREAMFNEARELSDAIARGERERPRPALEAMFDEDCDDDEPPRAA